MQSDTTSTILPQLSLSAGLQACKAVWLEVAEATCQLHLENSKFPPSAVCLQACKAVRLEVAEATCQLHLEKSLTQEEFIRGRMPHNPYSSAEAGPLMRDVKNFICRQLDMAGARQLVSMKHAEEQIPIVLPSATSPLPKSLAAFGMELLVLV